MLEDMQKERTKENGVINNNKDDDNRNSSLSQHLQVHQEPHFHSLPLPEVRSV